MRKFDAWLDNTKDRCFNCDSLTNCKQTYSGELICCFCVYHNDAFYCNECAVVEQVMELRPRQHGRTARITMNAGLADLFE